MEVAEEMNLKKKITITPSTVVRPIIADGKIVDIDKAGKIERKGTIEIQLNLSEHNKHLIFSSPNAVHLTLRQIPATG